jgi:hypothetical protein
MNGGKGKPPACPAPYARPARSSPLRAVPGQDAQQCHDESAADGRAAELDACIKAMVEDAPPLTGEQRDKLALILRGHRGR